MRCWRCPSPSLLRAVALAMALAVPAASGQDRTRGGKDTPTRAELLTRVEAQEPAVAKARSDLQGTSPEVDDCLALAQLYRKTAREADAAALARTMKTQLRRIEKEASASP